MAAKRFTQNVEVRPQNMSTGAAGGMMNLASRLDQFSSTIKSAATQAGARRGAREGANVELGTTEVEGREVTAAPERRVASLWEIIAAGGEETNAYNRTVGGAYIASLANDNREALSAIEMQNKDDIQKFNISADAFNKGVMDTVDPALRGAVRQQLDDLLTSGRMRVQQRAETKNINNANASLQETISSSGDAAARLARNGSPIEAQESLMLSFVSLDNMVKSGAITSAQATETKTAQTREVKEQTRRREFDQIFASDNPIVEQFTEAYQHLEDIAAKVPRGWTPDQWDSFIGSQEADLNSRARKADKLQAEQSMGTALQVSNLKIAARTGLGEPSRIIKEADELFASQKITGNERASIITSVINGQKQGAKTLAENTEHLNNVARRLAGDSSQVLSQKDVDYAWDNVYSKDISDDPIRRNAQIVQFVDDTKSIPTTVKRQVINDINSEDPDLVVAAADIMDRLDTVRGIPENNFTANERAMSVAMSGLIKNMDGKEALALARRATDPNDRSRIDLRTDQIKDMKKTTYGMGGLNYVDVVQGEYDVREFDSAVLADEYGVLFEQNYIAGMSKDDAEEKAKQVLDRNWGEFNDQFMKYPPTDFYAVAGETDYIADQLYSDVVDFGFAGESFKKEDIVLMSNKDTARTASTGRPVYGVSVFIEGEGLIPLVGFKFHPDKQAEEARIENENNKAMEERRLKPKKAGDARLKEGLYRAIN